MYNISFKRFIKLTEKSAFWLFLMYLNADMDDVQKGKE